MEVTFPGPRFCGGESNPEGLQLGVCGNSSSPLLIWGLGGSELGRWAVPEPLHSQDAVKNPRGAAPRLGGPVQKVGWLSGEALGCCGDPVPRGGWGDSRGGKGSALAVQPARLQKLAS